MSSLLDILPAPVHHYEAEKRVETPKPKPKKVYNIPAYGMRENYIPRCREDYDDGGAFPEIHIIQYPLDMGRSEMAGEAKVVSVAVDEEGNADYDHNLLHQGRSSSLIVHSKVSSLVGYTGDVDDLSRPSDEEIAALTFKTQEAMGKKILHKTTNALPGKLPEGSLPSEVKPSEFYKYTPVDNLTGRQMPQRIIRMVEVAQDPLDPPKTRHKKVPGGFGDAPVPILHSPPRKVTVQDQQDWKIPPCVSNWKNARGLTIPLDKRLAADGRGMQKTVVNDGFATFAETLQAAERKMREEVELRNSIVQKQREKDKLSQDELLRQRAAEIRQEREDMEKSRDNNETPDERDSRVRRDTLREEMRRQRDKDMRLKSAGRRTREEREKERDVSEKIALGQIAAATATGVTYDSRLFEQNGGVSSGYSNDEVYNVYSKPLFVDKSETIYRARESESMKYVNDDTIAQMKAATAQWGEGEDKEADAADMKYVKESKRGGPLEFTSGSDSKKKKLSREE